MMHRTRRFTSRTVSVGAVALAALLAGATVGTAAGSPEQACEKGRYDAAAKYASCHQKVMGKYFAGAYPNYDKFDGALSKCRVKYTDTWAKLQAKARGSGSTCDHPRYEDSGDGTVTDRLTALQWERKANLDDTPNLEDPHDADNAYSWSATGTDADGSAFTSVLAALNSGACFAGQCDWRLPSLAELETILLKGFMCPTWPCIDQSVFGPTVVGFYWASTPDAAGPYRAGIVVFDMGSVNHLNKSVPGYVRAVRGGL